MGSNYLWKTDNQLNRVAQVRYAHGDELSDLPGVTRPVTIRTLDIGADMYPPYLRVPREDNPFLGWRSIRISLELASIFKVQLRAILRAAAHHDVRIMFPMISRSREEKT